MNIATPHPPKDHKLNTNDTLIGVANESRRILYGSEVREGRQYMVYLKLPPSHGNYRNYRQWFCSGVIVHEEYILTSAACIEDVKHFYVISGTYIHDVEDDIYTNDCYKNGARKAVWKCVPRNYMFDGHENDNLRWMSNDIAVVKVDEEFNFERRVKGCQFIPKPIKYNNESSLYEKPDTVATVAGWGSLDTFSNWMNRRQANFPKTLMEAKAEIMNKRNCMVRWGKRYYDIIENYMICTKDNLMDLSEICHDKYADCTDVMYSDEINSRRVPDPSKMIVHSANHNISARRARVPSSGGFCENDHGGPLVYEKSDNTLVIGVISACLVKERTNKCHGPFLYTSVFKNRNLINCAIHKKCISLRSSQDFIEEDLVWTDHPDGWKLTWDLASLVNSFSWNKASSSKDYLATDQVLALEDINYCRLKEHGRKLMRIKLVNIMKKSKI